MANESGQIPVDPTAERRKAEARARRVRAQEARQKAVEFRKMGMSYQAIAEQLGMAVSAVHKTITKAMAEVKARQDADAETIKTMELENLDRMQLAAWPHATKGSHLHIDRVLKIQERRAKLLGLDAPTKVAPTTPDGQESYQPKSLRDMSDEELLAEAAELDRKLQRDGSGTD